MSRGFFERSPEQEYFQSLEAVMIELRGAPLQLSPDDWQISKRWYADGIPVDLVRESIREVIEKRRGKDLEIPRRLAFYRQPVERAWKQVGALTAPDLRRAAPDFDLEGRLGRLAAAVEATLGRRSALADEVRGAASMGEVEAIEDRLAELDRRLLQEVAAGLDEGEKARLEAQLQGALLAYEDRYPEPASAEVLERLRFESLRRLSALPALSLFAPEAAEIGEDSSSGKI